MSTKLGTLTLDLVAKTSNFTGPIKDAEKQTKSSFDGMGKKITAFSAIAVSAIAAAGAGAYAMAREYANTASELQTFAAISNTTVQEFQSLSTGAQTVGISTEKLADQFKDFNEKLGEFITIGSGGAVDFFEQIAVKTEGSAEGARKLALEMQNLSGPKALQLYVDKLEEAGVTQQQMSFYLESMASDTTNLIPLLKNGGEGFKFWADAAEKAGVIMDESAIQKAAELKVQLGLLDLQIAGVKNQFIQGLMPSLVSIGDAMSQGAMDTGLMTKAGEDLGDVFKGVAVVGMGVYVVIKNLSNAISGLVADAIIAKQKMDLAAEGQGFFANLPGVKFTKSAFMTATLAGAGISHTGQALKENRDTTESLKKFISTTYSDATTEAVKAQAKLAQSQTGVIKGSDEWIKKQNEATKASNSLNKQLQEQARLLQEKNRIIYDYSSDNRQQELKLEEEIERLKKNGMSQYIPIAEERYKQEKKLAEMQFAWELTEHRYSEEQKLEYSFNVKEQEILADKKLTKEQREAKLQSLDEQYAIELQKTKFHALNMRQALQNSINGLSSGTDDIFAKATMSPREYEKWALENERANSQATLKQNRISVEQDIMTSTTYSSEDDRYEDLLKAHQEYRDAMAALDVQYAEASKALVEQQKLDQLNLWGSVLNQAQNTFAQLTQSAKDSAGEQSSVYRTMFAMQKAFSIASSLAAAYTAYSQAFADPSAMTLPQKLAGGATVMAALMPAVTTISSLAIDGMAHDGIDNVPKEGTWLLDKGERVVDSRTNSDLKNYLSNQKQQAPVINIHNAPPGTTATQNSDGSIDIDLVERQLANRLSNANSVISKSLKQNTTASRRR